MTKSGAPKSLLNDLTVGPPEDLPADPNLSYDPDRSAAGWIDRETESPPRDGSSTKRSIPLAPTIDYGKAPSRPNSDAPSDEVAEAGGYERSEGGDLRLLEVVGQGGFGDVWRAWQGSLQRIVAVKRLREDDEKPDRKLVEARRSFFRQEAVTAARLDHPNIVPVYDLGQDDEGHPLLVMKLVRGQPWRDLLAEDRRLPLPVLLDRHLPILLQVAKALAFAHSRGVVHRDVKPSQVMVGAYGEVLLTDWGLAIVYDRESGLEDPADPTLSAIPDPTNASSPAGTPAFMAPEQTQPRANQIGPWTDIYLLGGTLYYLLTGSAPHRAGSSRSSFEKATVAVVEPPEVRAPEIPIPRELNALTMTMLSPIPDDRPAGINEVIIALERYSGRAARQRDSIDLTDRISTTIASSSTSYGGLVDALAKLQRAEGLWVENPAIQTLRDHALSRYVDLALSHGDLRLARVQATGLSTGLGRDQALGRVVKAEESQQRRRNQRRNALLLAAALALTLIGGSFYFLYQQASAAESLRQERDRAQAERTRAEAMAGFMIEELWEKLEGVGRSDLLAPVAYQVLDHYDRREADGASPGERFGRARALAAVAAVLDLQGDKQAAIEAYSRSRLILEELDQVASVPSEEVRDSLYLSLLRLSESLADTGRQPEALATLAELERLARLALDEDPEDLLALGALIQSLDTVGVVYYDQGELEEALGTFTTARREGEVRLEPNGVLEADLLAMTVFHEAVCYGDLGLYEEALKAHRHSESMLERLATEDPEHQTSDRDLEFQSLLVAEVLVELGRTEEAQLRLDSVVPRIRLRFEEDPDNWENRYSLAFAMQGMGTLLNTLGQPEAARDSWREAARAAAVATPDSDHLYLLDARVRALLALGRLDEARPLVAALQARDWRHSGFQEHLANYGID